MNPPLSSPRESNYAAIYVTWRHRPLHFTLLFFTLLPPLVLISLDSESWKSAIGVSTHLLICRSVDAQCALRASSSSHLEREERE